MIGQKAKSTESSQVYVKQWEVDKNSLRGIHTKHVYSAVKLIISQ